MMLPNKIEKLVKKMHYKATSEAYDKALDSFLRAVEEHEEQHSASDKPSIWRTIMKSPITKIAAAAVIIVACSTGLILWKSTGSGIALADVLTRIEQVTAYMYQMHSTRTRQQTTKESTSTLLISQEYGIKMTSKTADPNNGDIQGSETYILPRQNSIIFVDHKKKTYVPMIWDGMKLDFYKEEYNDPHIIIKQILGCEHISLGQSVIDGVTVEGFQTTDLAYKGGFFGEDDYFVGEYKTVDVKLWVDVKTFLPVRLEEDIVTEKGTHIHQISYDFRWNVIVNPDDFEPNIPDDYTSPAGDIIFPAYNEENAVKGLRLFDDLAGNYPVSLELKTLGEEANKLMGYDGPDSLKGLSNDEKTKKTSELMSLGGPAFFYITLVEENKDPVYYGETVGPDDTEKVLLRWKLDDGQYRIIFGDLSAKTVTAEELAELEKQMLVHDVAIANMSVPSTSIKGDTVRAVISIANQGNCLESFDVKLTDVTDDKEVASWSVTLSTRDRGAAEADLTFTGENVDDWFGDRQWLEGDLNGDGVNDILVSATNWNNATGRVYLYYGGTNISSTPDLVLQGEGTGDYFGDWGMFTADMNGDNIDDLIVCSRTYNDRGRAYIFYGGTNMNNVADVIIDPPSADGTGLSYGAPCPGDFNGDNIMDLAVGAADYSNSTGRVYLYYGPVTSGASVDKTFTGEGELDRVGRAVVAGDVDGDNCDDLLLPDRYYPDRTAHTSGRAYLYWGASGTSMDTTIDITFDGEGTTVEFGHGGDILDIDNDGFADIVIGSPLYPNAPTDAGRVYLYWGKDRGSFTNTPDLIFDAPDGTNTHFGTGPVLEYADDDQYADLLVPAYGYDNENYRGRCYIFYGGPQGGMDTTADHTFTGDTTDFFGWRNSLGDVNGDNYGDVLLGGYGYDNYRGRALLWYGGPESSTQLKFNWNTTNASPGKHVLRASISPVEGEEDVADNSVTVTVEVKEPSK